MGASSHTKREARGALPSHSGSHSFAWRRYDPWFAQAAVLEDSEFLAGNRSSCSTIRSAALPSHFGGIAPFFHCPAINRARAGGSLLGSVPINSLVPMVMVSGRSVLSRRVRQGRSE